VNGGGKREGRRGRLELGQEGAEGWRGEGRRSESAWLIEMGAEEGEKERTVVNLVLGNGQIVVEQVEQLLLHQVDLGLSEQTSVPALKVSESAQLEVSLKRFKTRESRRALTQCLFFGL
jgi:hypothetical protein